LELRTQQHLIILMQALSSGPSSVAAPPGREPSSPPGRPPPFLFKPDLHDLALVLQFWIKALVAQAIEAKKVKDRRVLAWHQWGGRG